jgi:hypothetical protein
MVQQNTTPLISEASTIVPITVLSKTSAPTVEIKTEIELDRQHVAGRVDRSHTASNVTTLQAIGIDGDRSSSCAATSRDLED